MYGGQTSQLLRRLHYKMWDTNLHSWSSICQEHEGEDTFQLYLWDNFLWTVYSGDVVSFSCVHSAKHMCNHPNIPSVGITEIDDSGPLPAELRAFICVWIMRATLMCLTKHGRLQYTCRYNTWLVSEQLLYSWNMHQASKYNEDQHPTFTTVMQTMSTSYSPPQWSCLSFQEHHVTHQWHNRAE